ncbi:MAG: hypothetical protein ACEQSC_00205 [Candidatus Nanopelagicaceae bacterium]
MDFSASQIRVIVYIGDSGSSLDVSDNIASFSPITTTALDVVGFIKCETELTLNNANNPLDLDTRFNTRWSRSNKVTVEVRNAANTGWILHRTLRILSNAYDDGRRDTGAVSPSLRLKLGCKIALLDSNYQSQAGYKIPVLSPTPYVPFRTLLAYWLEYFGWNPLVVVSGDYAGNPDVIFDMPQAPGSSSAEHMGRFTNAYTGGYLWIDAAENTRIAAPTLTPTTATFVYDGRDCAINARSQNESEKPAGLVRVFGVSNFVSAYVDPPATPTSVTTGNVIEVSSVQVTTGVNTRTTVKEGTQQITGVSVTTGGGGSGSGANLGNFGSFKETTLEEYTGGFPSQPNPIAGQPNIPGSPPWLNRVTVSIEEQRITTGNNLGGRSQTKEVVTDYYYRFTYTTVEGVTVTGVEPSKIVVTTKILPEGTTGGFNANALVDEVRTSEWIYLSPGRYKFIPTTLRPNDTENRRNTDSNGGDSNSPPPSAQFAPSLIESQPVEIFGKAQFQYPPEAPDNNHPRDFNMGFYLPSNQRAADIAQYEGALIIGRAETQDLAVKPTDAWLTDPRPAPVAYIRDKPADTVDQVYLLDAASLLCGLRQQYVFGSGIWLGIRDRTTGVITAPYNIVLDYLTTESGDILTDEQGNLLYNG